MRYEAVATGTIVDFNANPAFLVLSFHSVLTMEYLEYLFITLYITIQIYGMSVKRKKKKMKLS